jgi:hypothetical protein
MPYQTSSPAAASSVSVRQQIIQKSIELLERQPEGIRFMVLDRALREAIADELLS